METNIKRIENSIGWKLGLFAVIAVYLQLGLIALLNMINPEIIQKASTNIALILPIVTVDIIGVPLFVLLTRKLPKAEVGNEKFTIGKFVLGIPVMSMIVVVGGLVGTAVQSAITPSSGTAGLQEILTGSLFFWRVLYVGVLAPIFEEIIFRKIMIDRLATRGKWFAIFVSALCFGLFHGNFSQFFYAFSLGLIWGVIYTRTGKIQITIGYHLIINLSTSAVGMVLMGMMDKTVVPFYAFIGVRYFLAIIGLVIFIVNFKKIFKIEDDSELKDGNLFKAAFTSWGLWIHYLVCISVFVYQIIAMNAAAVAAGPEEATNVTITYEVTVENGQIINEKEETVPFTISEAGNYVVVFDWFDNEDPGFITGARIDAEDGTTKLASTGALLRAEMKPEKYEAGNYKAVFSFLENNEEFAEYISKYCEDDSDGEKAECEYEKLGQDGTYTLKVNFVVRKYN